MTYSAGAAWDGRQGHTGIGRQNFVFDWGLTRSDITYDVVHVWEAPSFGWKIT